MDLEKKPETDSLLGSTVAHPDPHSLSDPGNNNGTAGGGAFADSSAGDAPHVTKAYDEIPVLEQTKLPRGGVSVETSAVGRIQVRAFICKLWMYHRLISCVKNTHIMLHD